MIFGTYNEFPFKLKSFILSIKRNHVVTTAMTAVITTAIAILNCTDNYDAAKIKMKSVTDHQ